jgi:hypothetical protein
MNVKTNYNEFSFLSFIYLFIFIPDEYTLIKAKEIIKIEILKLKQKNQGKSIITFLSLLFLHLQRNVLQHFTTLAFFNKKKFFFKTF